MGRERGRIAGVIIRYLEGPTRRNDASAAGDPSILSALLRPADVLLINGDNRMSTLIKYATQSIWSHAALYVGTMQNRRTTDGEPHVLVEANIREGVVSVPLSKYGQLNTRVCRPVGLTEADRSGVCKFAVDRIGMEYDLSSIFDLARDLLPTAVPRASRWRGSLGAAGPARFICSTLIAQAFEVARYPILPAVALSSSAERRGRPKTRLINVPRDFDVSPYFETLKTILSDHSIVARR